MDTKEKLKQILDKRGYYNTDLIAEIEELYKQDQALQSLQTDVSISLERAKKYARHQHFLGTQGSELVEFEDWAQD